MDVASGVTLKLLPKPEASGVHATFYASPETAHEWQTWRRCLYQMAPFSFAIALNPI